MLNWRDTLKEGPTTYPDRTIVIPGATTCGMCKYYEHQMVRSGNHPLYTNNCSHPDSSKQWGSMFHGNLVEIDGVVHTPDWCPFLKK